ncbi:MAG TPA: glycosyltransferase family 87 protein [Candidatus Dormibacteraeota bacterium]
MTRLGRPSLPAWAALVASAIVAAGLVGTLAGTIQSWGFDFGGYWSAAHIPLAQGWAHLYDRQVQALAYRGLGLAKPGDSYVNFYIAPPPLVWLVLPLVRLPFHAAAITWSLLQLVAILAAWWLAAPAGRLRRAITLLALLGAFPVAYTLFWGQAAGFILLGLAGAYVLIKHGQPVAAGLALCVLVLKPQDMFLVPFVLLAAGYWRVFAAWLAGSAVLAAASVILVGTSGIGQLLQLQRGFIGSGYSEGPLLTVGGLPTAIAGAAVIAVAALAWAWHTRDLATAFWVGITGSLASTPYIHDVDLALVLAAGWIALREREAGWTPWLVAAMWVAAELFLVGYPVLAFVGILTWAAGTVMLGRSRRAAGPQPVRGSALAASSA